jgi:hypothetical protein
MREAKPKMLFLLGVLGLWLAAFLALVLLVRVGVIPYDPVTIPVPDNGTDSDYPVPRTAPHVTLKLMTDAVDRLFINDNGHVDLYYPLRGQNISQANHTNSEAISYSMQIAAQNEDKARFDRQLTFMERKMQHPSGILMWRLDDQDIASGEGRNTAPDAELRALKALYLAKDRWGDPRYDKAIDRLAEGLEYVAVKDGLIVAYGGADGKPWRADESWMSYYDFQVIDRLANTRRGVWNDVAVRTRNVTLGAQLWNGLYNSGYFLDGREQPYGNGIDGGVYSINSLWILVRLAESDDPQLMTSARKGLHFYQEKYAGDSKIYASYDSSGNVVDEYEATWAYALVARAAYALGDKAFGQLMLDKMLMTQDEDPKSDAYGALIEGAAGDERVGQFTNQEAILTLQESLGKARRFTD